MAKLSRKGKAPDRRPCRGRYNAERRDLVHKRRRVLKSSHGKWTYEALVAHTQNRVPRKVTPKEEPVEV